MSGVGSITPAHPVVMQGPGSGPRSAAAPDHPLSAQAELGPARGRADPGPEGPGRGAPGRFPPRAERGSPGRPWGVQDGRGLAALGGTE